MLEIATLQGVVVEFGDACALRFHAPSTQRVNSSFFFYYYYYYGLPPDGLARQCLFVGCIRAVLFFVFF